MWVQGSRSSSTSSHGTHRSSTPRTLLSHSPTGCSSPPAKKHLQPWPPLRHILLLHTGSSKIGIIWRHTKQRGTRNWVQEENSLWRRLVGEKEPPLPQLIAQESEVLLGEHQGVKGRLHRHLLLLQSPGLDSFQPDTNPQAFEVCGGRRTTESSLQRLLMTNLHQNG